MINTRFQTAFHIVILVAINEGRGNQTTSHTVAAAVKTNASYIRTVMNPLIKHRILRSSVGFGGGVTLGRPPSEISLKDIYRAIFDHRSIWAYRKGSCDGEVNLAFVAIQAKVEAAMLAALEVESVASVIRGLA